MCHEPNVKFDRNIEFANSNWWSEIWILEFEVHWWCNSPLAHTYMLLDSLTKEKFDPYDMWFLDTQNKIRIFNFLPSIFSFYHFSLY